MPRRFRLWIDQFLAVQHLRNFLTSRAKRAKATLWPLARRLGRAARPLTAWLRARSAQGADDEKARPAKLELQPMDWRNPPSENIAQTALPLAAMAATAAAAVYFAATLEAHDRSVASAVTAERLGGYDSTPPGVPAVTLDPDPNLVGGGSRSEEQPAPELTAVNAAAPDESNDAAASAIDGAGSTLHATQEDAFGQHSGGGGGGGAGSAGAASASSTPGGSSNVSGDLGSTASGGIGGPNFADLGGNGSFILRPDAGSRSAAIGQKGAGPASIVGQAASAAGLGSVVGAKPNGGGGQKLSPFGGGSGSLLSLGTDTRVNTYTTNAQTNPAVAMDANGNFVVAWSGDGTSDISGIYAQRYASDGTPQGSEFRVNTFTFNSQVFPAVAMDADGDFVIAWSGSGADDISGIYAQRYASDGTPQGSEFRVNTFSLSLFTAQTRPSVAMDADGDFVVAWQSYGQEDTFSYGVYAQRYASDGTPQGSEFHVNTYTSNFQAHPSVAMDADGDFVVTWTSYWQDESPFLYNPGVYAQRYASDGTALGSEFRVNTYTTGVQYEPSVAVDADGDFVIAWQSIQDGSSYGIYAQRYASDGTALGSEFRVNTYTTDGQVNPAVAMDADGDFVVTWTGGSQDGSDSGIYAQRYVANGAALGSEFRVNTYTTNAQVLPAVAMDADGDFVVAWASHFQDGHFHGIYIGGGALVKPPAITGFADDTGTSNSDRLTYDTTPTINGISEPNATVALYLRRATEAAPTLMGTVTADAGGLWTYTFSAISTDATYAITAKAALSGLPSASSAPLTFTLDTTPPTLAVLLGCGAYDRRPELTVTATDLNGISSPATVTLDADLNGDLDFSDPGESGFATALLVDGAAAFTSYPLLTVGTTTYFRARVTDYAGNSGTSATTPVEVLPAPATDADLTPRDRSNYGGMAAWNADGLRYAGNVTAVQALDLDRSPSAARGANPYLIYNSQEASPAPVVQVKVQRDGTLGMPDAVTGTLTWDGAVVGTLTYDLSAISPGAEWVFAAQPTPTTTSLDTGRHTYTLDLFFDYPGTDDDFSYADPNYTFVVNRSASPYGAGWSFSDTDSLITIAADGANPGGVLRAFGNGGWAFYADAGDSDFTEPPGDAGTLVASDGGWIYTDWDGQVLTFDSSGRQTKWSSPSGEDVVTYTYDGADAGTAAKVVTVASPDNGLATFTYSSGLLSTIDAPGARTTTFAYTGSDLTLITDAAGGLHTLTYTSHRLTADTQGLAGVTYTYSSNGLVRTMQVGSDGVTTITAGAAAGLGTAAERTCGGVGGSVVNGLGKTFRTWYNPFGQVTRTQAPDGGVQKFTRDSNGWVTGYVDQLDRRTTYVVNARGQVLTETRPDGLSAYTSYDGPNGSRTGWIDFRSHSWDQSNDAYGRVLTITDPLDGITTYTYDNGRLNTVTDPRGNVTTYLYDTDRRPAGALVGNKVTGTTGYDAYGFANTFTDPLGSINEVTNDKLGRPVGTEDAKHNRTTTAYDVGGRVLWTSDERGNVTSYSYDAAGRVRAVIEAYGVPSLERRTTYSYDAAGQRESTLDPLGRRVTNVYDGVGRVIATVDPLGNRTTVFYNRAGEVTTRQDALGRSTNFDYDQIGRLEEVTDALGGVSTTAYDANSNVIASVDPLGNRATAVYDELNRRVNAIDPEGNTTTYAYDKASRLVAVVDPRGNTTTYDYDDRGNLTLVTDPLGRSTTYVYDEADNLATMTDARGNHTLFDYDQLNRPTDVRDAEGNETTTEYDAAGNVLAVIDAFGNRTTFQYDALNRQEAVIDHYNKRTTTVYDAGDRVSATVDQRGNRTSYSYDAMNRVTGTKDALLNQTAASYDAVGNLRSSTDQFGRTTNYAYDGLNRLGAVVDPLGNTSVTNYDQASRVLSTVDPVGNVTSYARDKAGRVTGETAAYNTPRAFATAYHYDKAGNVDQVTDAAGQLWTSTFDKLNRVIASTNPLLQTTATIYDEVGNVSVTVDARNYRTTYIYDRANKLIRREDAAGGIWTTTYDHTRVLSTTDALGNVTSYGYDSGGRVTLTLAAYGTSIVQRTSSTYDDAGNLRTVTDPFGRTTTYSYDQRNMRVATQDGAGKLWTTVYDKAGRVWMQIDPLGRATRTSYDAAGRVVAIQDTLGFGRETVYDKAGNAIATVDELGNRTTTIYDEANRPRVVIDALGNRTTTTYDGARVLSVQDPRNVVTSYGYDEAGRVEVTFEAYGTARERYTVYGYDASGNQSAIVDGLGRETLYTYDGLNRKVETRDASFHRWTVTYDKAGNLKSQKDPYNNTTIYNYDALNRQIEVVDALGNIATTAYDGTSGRREAKVDPRGNRTTFIYDSADRLWQVVDPFNKITTNVYDAAGQLVNSIDQLGKTTTFVYNQRGLREAVVDPLGNRTTSVFDAARRTIATVDPLGNRVTTLYDAVGRAIVAQDALGFRTTSIYDAVGNRTVLVDPLGNRTTWTYDELSQAVAEQDVGGTATFAYDDAGQLRSTTEKIASRRRDFDYDATGHKTSEVWLTSGVTVQLQTWTYDDAGRMLTAQDPDGSYVYQYDAVNRVKQVDGPFGLVLTYGYDKAGNRDSVKDSRGGVTTLSFDALNRQTSEQTAVSGGNPMRFDYAYTVRGQLSAVARYSDLSGTTTVALSVYTYDDAGRLRNLKHTAGGGAVLANYTYTYDNASRLTAKTENGTTTSYQYDNARQLKQDGAATFSYDASGNRTNPGYVIGAGNRITTDGVWTYTFNAEGNVTKRSKGASLDTWEYTYDHRNQMLTAKFSATDGGAATKLVTYAYDAGGARIQREGWDGTTTTTERYGYDGGDPAKPPALGNENTDAWVILDGSNTLVTRWVFGVGQDEVVARQTAAGAITWDLADRQGSVRQVIDNSATLLATSVFDAYGKLASGTIYDGYAYAGVRRDSITLLDSNGRGMREYSPEAGIWLQADPRWPLTGEANPFVYARNSPTNATDPSGMDGKPFWQKNALDWVLDPPTLPSLPSVAEVKQKVAEVQQVVTDKAQNLANKAETAIKAGDLSLMQMKIDAVKTGVNETQTALADLHYNAARTSEQIGKDIKKIGELAQVVDKNDVNSALASFYPSYGDDYLRGIRKQVETGALQSSMDLLAGLFFTAAAGNDAAARYIGGDSEKATTGLGAFTLGVGIESSPVQLAMLKERLNLLVAQSFHDGKPLFVLSKDGIALRSLPNDSPFIPRNDFERQFGHYRQPWTDLHGRLVESGRRADAQQFEFGQAASPFIEFVVTSVLGYGFEAQAVKMAEEFKDILAARRLARVVDQVESMKLPPRRSGTTRFFPDGEDLWIDSNGRMNGFVQRSSQVRPEPGYHDLIAHAGDKGTDLIRREAELGGISVRADIEAVVAQLQADGWKPGQRIRLVSCRTASPELGNRAFAQKLADRLGVVVKSPTTDVHIGANGELILQNEKPGIVGIRNDGMWLYINPKK